MRNKILLSLFLTLLIIGLQGKFAYISANPTVDFSYSGVCAGSPTVFSVDYVLPNINNVWKWHWDFGDGTYETNRDPVHTYAGPGPYTVTLTITDIFLHTGSAVHLISIQKLPIVNFSYSTPDCSNDSIQFTDLSDPVNGYIQQWHWNYGDGSPDETFVLPANQNPKHVFPNPGTYTVTLTVTNSNSCVNQIPIQLTVPSNPVANFYSDGQCEDQGVTFTDASFANGAGNIASWDWDFGDPTSGINNASGLKNPTHDFKNAGIYNVKLKIINFNGCKDSITKQLVIYPRPAVEYTNTNSCLGDEIYFAPDPLITNIPTIAAWRWDFGDGIILNASNPNHTYWFSGDYPVTLTATDLNGCINNVTHSIEVNPLPVAQFSTNQSYCAGAEVQFHDLSVISTSIGYIDSWEWNFGDGNTLIINHPGNPNVSHVYATAGTYNVTLTIKSSDGCSSSGSQSLIIHSNPLADFSFTTACTGTLAEFTDQTQLNGALPIMEWKWNFGDPVSGTSNFSDLQHPEHTFVATGNSIVQLIVTNGDGCTDTIAHTIRINTPPQVYFNTANNCQNSMVSFIPDSMVMNLAAITSWYWEFGSGVISILPNPTHIFATSGPHNVKLTVADTSGCTNTISRSVIIDSEPVVNFSFPQPVCIRSSVQFDNLSAVPGGFIVSNEWDFGDGNTRTSTSLASVSHTYSSYGTFSVTLTVTSNDGCRKSHSFPIIILPEPLADFSVQSNCVNSPVQFTDLSQPGSGTITVRSWNFGDPASGTANVSNAQSPAHTYTSASTYYVTLTVSNSGGCLDTIVRPVLIHGLPVVDFTATPGCINESTHFESSAIVNSGTIASWHWSFGDGYTSPAIDPDHAYTAPGSFNVTLTVTDTAGCSNTKTRSVVIQSPPSAVFDISVQNCVNNPVLFSVVPSASGSNIISFSWDFGDGTNTQINAPASGNTSHSYALSGTYKVILTVKTSAGCETKSQRTFTVSSSPVAQFTYDNSCAGGMVNFTDLSQVNSGPSLANWSWSFDDPASFANNTSDLQNPYHVFNAPGTYNVLMQVGNASGCTATVSKAIVIKPKPTVDFVWSGNCIGNPANFTINTVVTDLSSVSSCDWDFGDGTAHNTSTNPVHDYTVPGNFNVILTIYNTAGCKNTISHIVSILPQPNASFSSNSSCLGASTQFTDQSFTASGVPVIGWLWDFGDNTAINDTSDQKNPSWIYKKPGVYNVKLKITSQNGCQNTVTLPSQVFGNPTANFTYSASACDNGAVYFRDSSYNKQAPVVGFKWEFETNHYSNLEDPIHVFYGTDSCYDVRLIATDIRGCVDTVVKKACVPSELDFSFVASNFCLSDSTHFNPQLPASVLGTLVSFNWNFGDPASSSLNTSTKASPSHLYSQPGTYTVSLLATDVNNCSKTVYRDITILPLPVSYFSYTEGVCDSSILFNESSYSIGSSISQWRWDFGDGVIKPIAAPDASDVTHQYFAAGTYTVGLTVTNTVGCSTNISVKDILVKPCLTAAFELIDTMLCQNITLSFIDKSYSGNLSNEWNWDFGDGTRTKYYTYADRVTHVFKSSGTFKVQMVISTTVAGRKVSDTATMNVLVNPTPLPDFISGVVCHEQTAVFTNMTSGNGTKISNYNWSFGEPLSGTSDTSTMKNPVHLYNAPGTYEVKLTVKNKLGCTDSIRKSLIVYGLPDANYKYSVSCAGDKTSFSDLSISTTAPLTEWEWTFYDEQGVAGKADTKNPDFIYNTPGDYLVNLKVTDEYGCYDTINQYVTTWTVPISLFTFKENYKDIQGQLQMKNISIDATKYYWDFGDGTGSYAENPVAFYNNDGTFDITLVTRNDKGCSDTLNLQYEFMVKGLYIPNAFSPENPNTEVNLLKPVGINLDQYRFEVYDRWGNLLWWTNKLDGEGRPLEGWDGKYKGSLVPEGAYPWRAFGVFKDGSIWEAENIGNNENLPGFRVGTATLIR